MFTRFSSNSAEWNALYWSVGIFYKFSENHNCKGKYLISPMESTLCEIQYVGTAETPFNIPLYP